jgi:hypothetical protein
MTNVATRLEYLSNNFVMNNLSSVLVEISSTNKGPEAYSAIVMQLQEEIIQLEILLLDQWEELQAMAPAVEDGSMGSLELLLPTQRYMQIQAYIDINQEIMNKLKTKFGI